MAKINMNTLITGWAAELGRVDVFPPPNFFCEIGPGKYDFEGRILNLMNTAALSKTEAVIQARREAYRRNQEDPTFHVHTNGHNTLVADQVYGRTRTSVEMARFIGSKRGAKNAVVLMNGDGFDSARLTQLQTQIRQQIQQNFREMKERMIIPYQALISAGLDLDSVLPIHISGDKTVSTVVKVPRPPMNVLMGNDPSRDVRRKQFTWNDLEYQASYQHPHNPGTRVEPHYQINWVPEFSANRSWHDIALHSKTGDWMVTEQVHRLGSTVFSAVGQDDKRHRWVSSFDQNENPPMYFLAQLPDKGGVRYLGHALKLLAPDIVHKARSEGRRVFRQGDIFFVETKLTDEDFARERIAHRRAVFVYHETPEVLTTINYVANTSASSSYTMVPSHPQGTINIYMPSISLGANDSTAWVGSTNVDLGGPWEIREKANKDLKLRRAIMLYGTGHTASLVIQTKDRGTFVKGVVFHDPILENIRGNRTPEHRPLYLTEGKWFLAVRNNVPRRSTNPTPTEGEATNGATRNDPVPRVQGNVPARRRVSERRLPVGAASGN